MKLLYKNENGDAIYQGNNDVLYFTKVCWYIVDNLGSFQHFIDNVYTKEECISYIEQKLIEAETTTLDLDKFNDTRFANLSMEQKWHDFCLGEYKPHPLYDISVRLQEKEKKLYELCTSLICDDTNYFDWENIKYKMKYKIYHLHMELPEAINERKFRPGNEGYMDALNDFAK